MKRKISTFLFPVFYLLQTLNCYAQVANYTLGSRLEFKKSGLISQPLLYKAAIGTVNFHAYVGGISFELTAIPENNIKGQAIMLMYDSEKSDGYRLQIKLGNKNDSVYYSNIPDWQLIPIANYANDSSNAIFTLAGDVSDISNETPIRYHPAFKDQLLGLRMFQADLLFTRHGGSDLAYLPRDSATHSLLIAENEKEIRLDTTEAYWNYMNLKEELSESCPLYDSYILTDWGKEVNFGIIGNEFYISGEPYYLFTNKSENNNKWVYVLKDLLRTMRLSAPFLNDSAFIVLSKLLEKPKTNKADVAKICIKLTELSYSYDEPYYEWFKNKRYEFNYVYNKEDTIKILNGLKNSFDVLKKGKLNADSDFNSLDTLLKTGIFSWTKDAIREVIYKLEEKYPIKLDIDSDTYPTGSYKIDLLLCESKEFEEYNNKIFDFNPVVFSSCITTMRYAAFFRYVKTKYPEAWSNFMSQISNFKGKFILPAKDDPIFKNGINTPDQFIK